MSRASRETQRKLGMSDSPDSEIGKFELVPQEFGSRVQKTLASLGESEASLEVAVKGVDELLSDSVALAQDLYRSRYKLLAISKAE